MTAYEPMVILTLVGFTGWPKSFHFCAILRLVGYPRCSSFRVISFLGLAYSSR